MWELPSSAGGALSELPLSREKIGWLIGPRSSGRVSIAGGVGWVEEGDEDFCLA